MRSLLRTIAAVRRLAGPYFRSEDRWRAWALLAAVTALSLASVAISVRMNRWNRDFFNAVQFRDLHAWRAQVMVFFVVVLAQLVIGLSLLYLIQWLEIRWRRWMTARYIAGWLERSAHYRMQLGGARVDNPDQRIAQDLQLFVNRTLVMIFGDRSIPMSTGLLGAAASLGSFVVILWGISARMPMPLFGGRVVIPGFLVWAALIYAAVTTLATHLVGRKLVGLRFEQQRYEADFRFELVNVRENCEQIALLKGEDAQRARLMGRFDAVVHNWRQLMARQVKLGAATTTAGAVSMIVPSLLVAPAFFIGAIQFGDLMQISNAFVVVQGPFSFFVIP